MGKSGLAGSKMGISWGFPYQAPIARKLAQYHGIRVIFISLYPTFSCRRGRRYYHLSFQKDYVMNFDIIDDSVPILDIFVHVYIVFVYEYVFPFEFVFSICAFLTFYSTGIPFQIYLYLYIVLYSYLHFCLVFSICVFLTFHRDPTQRGFAHSPLSSLFGILQSTTVFVFAFVFVFVSISIFV